MTKGSRTKIHSWYLVPGRTGMDLPGFLFYRELMELYPNAKVILTVRDPEKWYVSVADTFRNSMPEIVNFSECAC